jgi:hypothetical protein
VTHARIVTASGTGRAAAIEIGTAIHGARRHATEERATVPANPAVTAGRAARIATIAITVEENIAARRVVPRDPVPMGPVPMGPVPMGRAAMPAAAMVVRSEQMCPHATRAATVPRRRARVNRSSAPIVESVAAVGAGVVAADAAKAARTPATDS